eukprot:TRINITY_DN1566_c0_g1_i18.p1 TRINITY_DN1566_c0_g1~~TRINITY_DN1566_c0_g1_i18.p1  ORF type:complete len:281 (+),score=51.52 TRINITY_DN1566_c0_g1_i18:122-964(+)
MKYLFQVSFLVATSFLFEPTYSTAVQVAASGALEDGSSASALGQGFGSVVTGDAVVAVTPTVSSSSVVLTATGGAPKPKPIVKPIVKPTPKPKSTTVVVTKPVSYSKAYVAKKPTCDDIKDDKCYNIDTYKKCGFCVEKKYPLYGYGCSYVEEKVKKVKESGKKSVEDYEVKIVPKCDCKGVFILEGKACPNCDSLLVELLACAGVKKATGKIEIPEKCLKQLHVDEKYLKECGYYDKPEANKKVVVLPEKKPEVVVVTHKKTPVVVVDPKKTPCTFMNT